MTRKWHPEKLTEVLGTLFLILAGILAVLIFVDRRTDVGFPFPRFWYTSRSFHPLFLVALAVLGWLSHRHAAAAASQTRTVAGPVFQSVVVFTRPNCSLCDKAMGILRQHEDAIRFLETVDISDSEELEQLYGESIPVVQIENQIRFRGIVNVELLERLIEARRRQQRMPNSRGVDSAGQGG